MSDPAPASYTGAFVAGALFAGGVVVALVIKVGPAVWAGVLALMGRPGPVLPTLPARAPDAGRAIDDDLSNLHATVEALRLSVNAIGVPAECRACTALGVQLGVVHAKIVEIDKAVALLVRTAELREQFRLEALAQRSRT